MPFYAIIIETETAEKFEFIKKNILALIDEWINQLTV